MLLHGVVEDIDRREALAAGIAGVGQEASGLLDVVGNPCLGGVTVRVGRGEEMGRRLAGLHDLGTDGVAVDGHGEGAAHALVVQRRPGDVDTVKVTADPRVDANLLGMVRLVFGYLGLGHALGNVQAPGAELTFFGVFIVDGIEVDPAIEHALGVPIVRIRPDFDHGVGYPFGQRVGTVADEVAGAGPFGGAVVDGAKLLDGLLMDREPTVVAMKL